MAKIYRFSPESAVALALGKGNQIGLPVGTPMIQQGVLNLVRGLYQDGITFTVDESSPYFQQLTAQFGGRMQNTRAPGAGPAPVPGSIPVQAPATLGHFPGMPAIPVAPQVPVQAPMMGAAPAGGSGITILPPGMPMPPTQGVPGHVGAPAFIGQPGMPGGQAMPLPGAQVGVPAPGQLLPTIH